MRLRPTEVFSSSKGKKKFVFQDIVKNTDKYYYLIIDGKMKTDLYNKGVVDGTKKALPLVKLENETILKDKWVLAILKSSVDSHMISKDEKYFVGRIGVVKTFILNVSNIDTFLEYTCSLTECPFNGKKDCFKLNHKFDCSLPNRERHMAGRYSYA